MKNKDSFMHYWFGRSQAEMTHTCRGSISLHGALIYTEDTCNLVVSNGGTQTFHLRATSEVERQRYGFVWDAYDNNYTFRYVMTPVCHVSCCR
jgi:hypothetical protein